jgi:esterase/lipase
MRDVGRHLRERHCFTVRAILLPGHGTVPGDLLEVTYQEWIAAARFGIDSFAGAVDDLYIAGFSTGGTLALYHALAAPAPAAPPIRGLILFSPAIQVADVLAPLANWHRIYSWAIPRGEWIGKLFDEHDDVKYESFAKNAGDQIYLLTHEVAAAARGRRLPTPLFVALSQDDATVSSRATIEFFRQVTPATGSPNALIAYTRVPEAIGGPGPIRDRISVYPDQGIIAFSHVAIPVRPDNPHYGRNGTYRSCLEYEKADNERAADLQACRAWREGRRTGAGAGADHRWCRCRDGEVPADGVRLGETSAAALHALEAASALKGLEPPLVLRRLTFNPDFDGMMAEVDAFLDRIQRQPR